MDLQPLHPGSCVTSLPPDVLTRIGMLMDKATIMCFRQMNRRSRETMMYPLRLWASRRTKMAAYPRMIAPKTMEESVYGDALASFVFGKHEIIVRGYMHDACFESLMQLIAICNPAPQRKLEIVGRDPLSSSATLAIYEATHRSHKLYHVRILAPPPLGLEHIMFAGNDFFLELHCSVYADSQRIVDAIKLCAAQGKRGSMILRIRSLKNEWMTKPIAIAWNEFGPVRNVHILEFI